MSEVLFGGGEANFELGLEVKKENFETHIFRWVMRLMRKSVCKKGTHYASARTSEYGQG